MGGRNRRADLVDQRGDSSSEEASSPSYHVQRPQHHVFDYLNYGLASAHSTATEREVDEKIEA